MFEVTTKGGLVAINASTGTAIEAKRLFDHAGKTVYTCVMQY